MRNLKVFYFLSLAFSINACTRELDVTADWKETTVVTGVLDNNLNTNYVRVSKAFLDQKTSAYLLAQVYDSLFFDTSKVVVRIEECKNSQVQNTFFLKPDNSVVKDTGIFTNPNQLLYRLDHKLDSSALYRLYIKTPQGVEILSQTYIIDEPFLSKPNASLRINWSGTQGTTIEYLTSTFAKTYELVARVHYNEYVKPNANANPTRKSFDFKVANGEITNVNAFGNTVSAKLFGKDLFRQMADEIPVIDSLNRRLIGVEFIIAVGTQDLANYIEINKPSNSIVQNRPVYTNITNGLGIFSSRTTSPNMAIVEQQAGYPLTSPNFRLPELNRGLDSLIIKYPQLNFLNF